jgi:hypothetical protein
VLLDYLWFLKTDVTSLGYEVLNYRMISEFERIWRGVALAEFEILSQYLTGGTEKSMRKVSHNSQSPGHDLNV